jgi:hypothetical protein
MKNDNQATSLPKYRFKDQITTKSTKNSAIEIQRRMSDATLIFAGTIPSVQSTKTNED